MLLLASPVAAARRRSIISSHRLIDSMLSIVKLYVVVKCVQISCSRMSENKLHEAFNQSLRLLVWPLCSEFCWPISPTTPVGFWLHLRVPHCAVFHAGLRPISWRRSRDCGWRPVWFHFGWMSSTDLALMNADAVPCHGLFRNPGCARRLSEV
jgi:hypothetical protein